MDYTKIAKQYISDVVSGKVLTSKTTQKCIQRHLNDLQVAPEKGWYFDENEGHRVIKFSALLKHTKGRKYAGKQFIPEPWQCAILHILFGWKKKDGTRRFSKAYVEVPKKNGKTTFAGLIGDYLLIMDEEPEAEVYCAATKRDQAKICFNQAKAFIEKNTALREFTGAKFVTNNVSIPKTGSKMEPIGRDSYGLDGINPSGAIIDEYHEWSKNDVLDVIESASVGRAQTLIFIITTAGFNKTWPCYDFRRFCLDILDGVKIQDDVFVMIYTLDETDDWKDETNWAKANPNYGISVEIEKLRQNYLNAYNRGGRTEVNFKTKNLNIWVDAPETWVPDEVILENNGTTKEEDLKGQLCYAGLDLASHTDINALCLFFPDIKGKKVARFHFWVPESKIIERGDKVDYGHWLHLGYLHVTPGNVVDIDQQVSDITRLLKNYNLQGLAYDPAKAYNGTIQGLMKEGFEKQLHEFSQGIRTMSEPTKELERILANREMDLMSNPVIRWMFRNVVIMRDTNDNIKCDRKRSQDKIDGVVALVNAIGEWVTLKNSNKQAYKNHTLRVLKT